MKLKNPFDRFRRNPNGETVRIDGDLKRYGNGYFLEIGQYFKTAQILLLVLLVLFFTVFSLTNSESITYRNLYYFAKDFRTAIDNTDASGDGFAYDVDGDAAFEVYKGGLAIAGNERLRILTAAGGINLSATLPLARPALSASTDLLLVYGRGETSCHIYNSFTCIHSETVEGAIRSAHLSESGAYSVVADDDSYESAVYVYSRNFQKINKYNLNSCAVAAPLSADGRTVAILSYTVRDGYFTTALRLAEVGTDRILCDYSVEDAFPLDVVFTAEDRVLLLTETGLHSVSGKDGGVRVAAFGAGEEIERFSFDSDGAAVLLKDDRGKCTVAVYAADGTLSYEQAVQESVRSLRKCGTVVFFQTETKIVRLSKDGTEAVDCPLYGGTLLAVSEDRAMLCTAGEAGYYSFGR